MGRDVAFVGLICHALNVRRIRRGDHGQLSPVIRQSKTILTRSCEAVRSEIDQPKTLCNLAGIYVASQGGFQVRYELLLQGIND